MPLRDRAILPLIAALGRGRKTRGRPMPYTSCAGYTVARTIRDPSWLPGPRISEPHHCYRIVQFATCAFTAGTLAFAAPAIAGCNSGNAEQTDLLTSARCQAHAPADGGVAVGDGAAAGKFAVGLGSGARAVRTGQIVIGHSNVPDDGNEGAVRVGWIAGGGGTGVYSTAIGARSSAAGNYSTAIGGSTPFSPFPPSTRALGA
ncbi:MAG: hypothetical protein QOD94_1078, partial [Alphaproteobacteria bacterium]|nr:hypothetical protein [Alphaproteobacteria bacterium]